MSIYVGNLSYQVTQDDILAVFREYGTVKQVQVPTDRETGRPRGFCFIGAVAQGVTAVVVMAGSPKVEAIELAQRSRRSYHRRSVEFGFQLPTRS